MWEFNSKLVLRTGEVHSYQDLMLEMLSFPAWGRTFVKRKTDLKKKDFWKKNCYVIYKRFVHRVDNEKPIDIFIPMKNLRKSESLSLFFDGLLKYRNYNVGTSALKIMVFEYIEMIVGATLVLSIGILMWDYK